MIDVLSVSVLNSAAFVCLPSSPLHDLFSSVAASVVPLVHLLTVTGSLAGQVAESWSSWLF